ncbi:hypothetical protein [Roseovarius arcticus]|uniref:hypothetical protein n=1 Tax=Roseovarius arcticus TaxID=2547404 RepID=UPI0011108536|nr:hypothetical protein [Roseovarius arcticus]
MRDLRNPFRNFQLENRSYYSTPESPSDPDPEIFRFFCSVIVELFFQIRFDPAFGDFESGPGSPREVQEPLGV